VHLSRSDPLVIVAANATRALAATEADMASSAVNTLLQDWSDNAHSSFNGLQGSLFTSSCPQIDIGGGTDGNCWWWSAVAWNALSTYAEDNPSSSFTSTIESDLWTTYNTICYNYPQYTNYSYGQCPSTADQNGKDPFTINTAGNTYFDDIGWWTQTWLNAYKLVGRPYYLYLAEELWNYVTNNGYKGTCAGGIVQFHKSNGDIGTEDAFANALYLRNSAWLYTITGNSKYMTGTTGGGAMNAASWIRGNLIYKYDGPALGNPGSHFMIADHADPSTCSASGNLSALQSQGLMVNAWTDMGAACGKYGGCSASPGYYYNLADELARSVTYDQREPTPNGGFTWPFQTDPGQTEPTVDSNGVLSEPCFPVGVSVHGSPSDPWPDGCSLGTDMGSFKSYMISKGIFEQAIYCSNHFLSDQTLKDFAHTNGSHILNANFEFLWDNGGGSNSVQNFATHTSVLDGLEADTEAPAMGGSYAMC
jgi:Glycosyl hydrolase family 76